MRNKIKYFIELFFLFYQHFSMRTSGQDYLFFASSSQIIFYKIWREIKKKNKQNFTKTNTKKNKPIKKIRKKRKKKKKDH